VIINNVVPQKLAGKIKYNPSTPQKIIIIKITTTNKIKLIVAEVA